MDRLQKVLLSQYKRYLRQPEDNIIFVIDETDMKKWYALIIGNHEPYKNAEILFRFTVPDEYPHKPPSVECLTPNGIFELGGPLCVSISEFHKESWIKFLGITGYGKQLWNALLCFTQEDTISSIRVTWCPEEERKQLAQQSFTYNQQYNKKIYDLIDNYISMNPDFEAVQLCIQNRLSSLNT